MDDEAALIAAILASPHDEAPRLAYADWLLERDDPRGEWLQVTLELQRLVWNPPTSTLPDLRRIREYARLQKRLRELRHVVDQTWALRIQLGQIEYCHSTDSHVMCPQQWLKLLETEQPNLRQCTQCQRFIRYCRTVHEVEYCVRNGQPIVKALALEPDKPRT